MAIAPKDEFGTPFGQAGTSANATKTAAQIATEAQATTKANAAAAATANPTVANINRFIASLQADLVDKNVASGLNPDGTTPAVKPTTRVAQNAANEAAGPPGDAPAGYYYAFVQNNAGGFWKLYKKPTSVVTGGGDTGGGTGGGTGGTGGATETGTPTTSVDVLKAMLKGLGFTSTVIDSSATYLNSLLKDGLDYDNAVQVFLNTKDYTLKNGTKLSSPFYEQYGYLNEGLTTPKTASELFNAVEGYKGLQTKYGFSDKYLSSDSLKNYVKNNVSVSELDERANAARLAAINADPAKTEALVKLGYIAQAADLQDFYMDSKIGKEQLETNRNTGAFVAEAIRRAGSGLLVENIQMNNYKQIAASLTGKGYTEAQVAQLASTGFQNIAEELAPTVALSGIYEKTVGNQDTTSMIQSELQNEEFMNMASARRKKLAEQNKNAFAGQAGLFTRMGQTGSIGSTSTGGIL
jgi:hypothetical protein